MKNLAHYIKNSSLSLAQLSSKAGIPEARLKALSDEVISPSHSELRGISEILKLPISFLLSEHQSDRKYDVLFRKQLGTTSDATAINSFNYYVENILKLAPDVTKVKDIQQNIPPTENTYQNAEIQAYLFRKFYFDDNQLDPIISLPEILSNNLNFVVKVKELGKNADGASASIGNFIFLIVSPRFLGRMLFTLAHELGHVINHHEKGDYVYLDKQISLSPKNDRSMVEGYANAFASCLLLPEKGVAKMIAQVRKAFQIGEAAPLSDVEILYLSRFYGVSFDVAASRCESLNLLPKGGAYSLSAQIKEDFISAEKRADKIGVPQREDIYFPPAPDFLLNKVVRLIETGDYSIGKIAEMISVPVNVILDYHSKIG